MLPQSLSAHLTQDDLKTKQEFYILFNSDYDLENAHSAWRCKYRMANGIESDAFELIISVTLHVALPAVGIIYANKIV